jgi:hypothetical protein
MSKKAHLGHRYIEAQGVGEHKDNFGHCVVLSGAQDAKAGENPPLRPY